MKKVIITLARDQVYSTGERKQLCSSAVTRTRRGLQLVASGELRAYAWHCTVGAFAPLHIRRHGEFSSPFLACAPRSRRRPTSFRLSAFRSSASSGPMRGCLRTIWRAASPRRSSALCPRRSMTSNISSSQSLAGYGVVKIYFQPSVNINAAQAQVTSDLANDSEAAAGGHHAAADPELQRLERADHTARAFERHAVADEALRPCEQLHQAAARDRRRRGAAFALWRKGAPAADRSRSAARCIHTVFPRRTSSTRSHSRT